MDVTATCIITASGVLVRGLSLEYPRLGLIGSMNAYEGVSALCATGSGAQVEVEDCDLTSTLQGNGSGIEVLTGALLHVRRTRIHDCGRYGVHVKSGRVTLEDCDIIRVGRSALRIEAGGATVRQSRLVQNEEWAVQASAGTQGVFEGNDLRSNKKGPWNLPASSPHLFQRHNNQE